LKKRTIIFLFSAILLSACAPSSMEEFRREGEAISRKLTMQLQKVETREDLVEMLPEIKKRYEEIVDLMIDLNTFKERHLGEAVDAWYVSDQLASETLMIEMQRIYRLEGGRELMEGAQKESLFRLDGVLRKTATSNTRK
jgi:hypothetical protein